MAKGRGDKTLGGSSKGSSESSCGPSSHPGQVEIGQAPQGRYRVVSAATHRVAKKAA